MKIHLLAIQSFCSTVVCKVARRTIFCTANQRQLWDARNLSGLYLACYEVHKCTVLSPLSPLIIF